MATTVLTGYSKAFPDIALRIRARVLDWTGTSVIAQQTQDAPHPITLWSFPGLPRANYIFSLDSIDAGGIPVENLAYFNIVPGQLNGFIVRGDEQYQVGGVNSGLVAGHSVAVFDGTAGVPDFRNWSIWPSISAGPNNPLVKGVDFSWDEVTGTLILLQGGDSFQDQAWWHFKFDEQDNNGAQSVPTVLDYTIRLVTANYAVQYEDFANALITEPADEYMELAFPDITTIPVGRELKTEFGGTDLTCVKAVPNGGDVMPVVYGLPGESAIFYRFTRPDTTNEWRVKFTGENKLVGTIVNSDQIQASIFLNYKRCDDQVCNIRQHARLYYTFVLNLPGAQVCAFADWATGNNKYLFSLANGGGDFHVPDTRGLTVKSTVAGTSGIFEDWMALNHKHETDNYTTNPASSNFGGTTIPRARMGTFQNIIPGFSAMTNIPVNTDGSVINAGNLGSEIKVKSIYKNQYVLL